MVYKSTGTSLWLLPNATATNASGFSGLPGGYRSNDGTFFAFGNYGIWWSSSEYNTSDAWFRSLLYSLGSADRGSSDKENGFSVRCLRD
jgi:uncharacterized protein (TIGR02145 family)